MDDATIMIHSDGKADVCGIQQPLAEVVLLSPVDGVLVIRVPGHTYWTGLTCPRGYSPVELQVFTFTSLQRDRSDWLIRGKRVVSVDARKRGLQLAEMTKQLEYAAKVHAPKKKAKT